jgi:hypothetical protein
MSSRLRWLPITITTLISYLFASAPGKKLLFFEDVFAEPVHTFVFDHPLVILFVLLAIYIIAEIIIFYRNNNKTLETQCHNMCRYIYKYIEKNISTDFTHSSRITIFKTKKPNTEGVYLKAVSRYQVKEPFRKTRVEFRPGEGVVGCCFETQTLIYANLPEYNERNSESYYNESWRSYKLDASKIDKLNVKSCLLLGIPIKCFDTEKTWGVLVLDSTKKDERFSEEFARKVEEIIEHYTAFFTEEDKQ